VSAAAITSEFRGPALMQCTYVEQSQCCQLTNKTSNLPSTFLSEIKNKNYRLTKRIFRLRCKEFPPCLNLKYLYCAFFPFPVSFLLTMTFCRQEDHGSIRDTCNKCLCITVGQLGQRPTHCPTQFSSTVNRPGPKIDHWPLATRLRMSGVNLHSPIA
jgi:hypothetical protein